MSGAITWEQAVFIVGILAAFVGLVAAIWFRIEQRINDASEIARFTQKNLDDFKLDVTKNYASILHIQSVEERLVRAVDELKHSINEMPTRVASIMKAGSER
jgi:hypothetical protein